MRASAAEKKLSCATAWAGSAGATAGGRADGAIDGAATFRSVIISNLRKVQRLHVCSLRAEGALRAVAYAFPARRSGRQFRIVAAVADPYRGFMVLSLSLEPPQLVKATIAGVITSQEQADLVAFIRSAASNAGSACVLLCLESFAGWNPDSRFDSHDLWLRDDEGVTKVAIVGPPEWKAAVLTLLAQPVRRVPIAYFASELAARAWLGLDANPPDDFVSA